MKKKKIYIYQSTGAYVCYYNAVTTTSVRYNIYINVARARVCGANGNDTAADRVNGRWCVGDAAFSANDRLKYATDLTAMHGKTI